MSKLGSVALVGSSGCLLDTEYGELIDSHDTVIRFNAARVHGFEKHVGSQTHIRIMNGHCFSGTSDPTRFSQNDPNYISSLNNEHFYVKGYNGPEFHQGVLIHLNKNHINFLDESYIQYCGSFIQGHASVGLIGLLMSLEYSTNISVFGFDHGEISNNKRHYWESVKPGNMHSFNKEKNIFKQAEQENRIKIYR